jgi:hypothetical protein
MSKIPGPGIRLVLEERINHFEREGWTAEQDAQYTRGELLDAASCYITSADACGYGPNCVSFNNGYRPGEGTPGRWPWGSEYWKPTGDPVKDLTKAASLIVAEIDRLIRERELPK